MSLSRLLVGTTLALFTVAASAQDASSMRPGKETNAVTGEAFKIKSIDHTGFTVSSLDDALKFWVDVLGFKHLYTMTGDEPVIVLLTGNGPTDTIYENPSDDPTMK